jgi:hypothetical protein
MEKINGCALDVVCDGQDFNANFVNAPFIPGNEQKVIRYAGGCANLDEALKAGMPQYFIDAHKGIGKIVAFSGGTISTVDNIVGGRTVRERTDFAITYIPSLLKGAYGVYAMSTTPRTGQMELDGDFGGLLVNGHDRIDYKQDRAVIIQKDAIDIPADAVDWAKDVLPYLNLMQSWQKRDVNCAVLGFNGGGATWKELVWAVERSIPVLLIRGSGRKTDEFIAQFEAGTLRVKNLAEKDGDDIAVDPSLVSIADATDAASLRNVLVARGFIAA